MRSFWQQFSARERLIIFLGVVIILLGITYEFVWIPMQNEIVNLQQSVQAKQQATLIMQHLSPQHLNKQTTSRHSSITTITSDQLLNTVQESLNQANLNSFAKEIRQEQRNQLNVQFEAVGFDNLLSWLMTICQTYHIKVQTINISPTNNSGEVKASLTLGLS